MSAFAQVTMTGGMDAGLRLVDMKGATLNSIESNNTYTSNLTFLGTEDLGGGVSANFRYELDWVPTLSGSQSKGTPGVGDQSNQANALGNGYSFVGIKSATAGEVQFGTINTTALDANGAGQPFGTALGSGYKFIALGATRYQKTVAYETPVMNGFSFKGLVGFKDPYQNNPDTAGISATAAMPTNGRDGVQELGFKYSQGPLNVVASTLTTKSYSTAGSLNGCTGATSTASTVATSSSLDGGLGNACADGAQYKLNTVAANYTTGNLTVYGWMQTQKQDSQATANATSTTASTSGVYALSVVDRKAQGLAAKYQASPALSLSIGWRTLRRNDAETYNTSYGVGASPAAGGIGQTTKLKAIGADYAMSKRTSLYFRYENISDDAILYNTVSITGTGYTSGQSQGSGKISNTAFGVRTTF